MRWKKPTNQRTNEKKIVQSINRLTRYSINMCVLPFDLSLVDRVAFVCSMEAQVLRNMLPAYLICDRSTWAVGFYFHFFIYFIVHFISSLCIVRERARSLWHILNLNNSDGVVDLCVCFFSLSSSCSIFHEWIVSWTNPIMTPFKRIRLRDDSLSL